MTSHDPLDRSEPATKVIIVAGEVPWTGVAYTTRTGHRQAYDDPAALLRTIAELTGWAAPDDAPPKPTAADGQ